MYVTKHPTLCTVVFPDTHVNRPQEVVVVNASHKEPWDEIASLADEVKKKLIEVQKKYRSEAVTSVQMTDYFLDLLTNN